MLFICTVKTSLKALNEGTKQDNIPLGQFLQELLPVMKAKFSGHDTFPLRYGWLYKAVNHMNSGHYLKTSTNEDVEKAVIELGVGKNMVNAIRYWSDCTGVIFDKVNKDPYVTELGNYIFGDFDTHQGKDPYLEQKGSIWLIHFLLNFDDE
jgi:hypothetical protein